MKKLRSALVSAAALAAFTGLVAPAEAGLDEGATTITIDTVVERDDGRYTVVGEVQAPFKKCAVNRRVQLQVRQAGGYKTYDSGRSTQRAAFGLEINELNDIRVVAPKAKVKAGNGRVTCKRAVEGIVL